MKKLIGISTTIPPALCLAASALLATPAQAHEDDAGYWYLSPALEYVVTDDDRHADDSFGAQLGIGRYLSRSWNLELNLEGDDLDFKDSNGKFQQRGASLDGLFFFDRSTAFSPYGLIGAGALRTKVPGESSTNAMANVGFGFLSNAMSDRVALRGEIRYRWDNDDNSIPTEDSFGDWIVSVGLNIRLGSMAEPAPAAKPVAAAPMPAAPVAAAPKDSDGDGVTDDNDACPDSAPGAKVDSRGCELDSDGDGVVDSMDHCPSTPAGAKVDAHGCELDSDGDGVVDSQDRCPDTQPGARVDVHGCEIQEVTVLKGVNFETGSAKLLPESTDTLDETAETLVKHPEIKAEVAGYTDNRGSRALNLKLSQQRAEAVMKYLVAKGVSADNLTAHGYGPDHPAEDNGTADGRAANRRVELHIEK